MMDLTGLKDRSIIVCGIVRDAANGLKRNIPVMDAFANYWGDCKFLFFENDSKDDSKAILKEWEGRCQGKVHVVTENRNSVQTTPASSEVSCNPFFSARRIEKMAELRNQYLKYIEEQHWKADFLMVVDMDVAAIDLGGLLSSFDLDREWDAVTAFGYSTSPKLKRRYHDTYALTEWGDEGNPQTEKKVKELAEKYGSLRSTDDWVRVFSAFGGIAIYRFNRIRGLRYQALPNNDPRVEVYCEHYSLYKQMAQQGEIKVYINPRMVVKYQRVSLKIVWNSIRRRVFGR